MNVPPSHAFVNEIINRRRVVVDELRHLNRLLDLYEAPYEPVHFERPSSPFLDAKEAVR